MRCSKNIRVITSWDKEFDHLRDLKYIQCVNEEGHVGGHLIIVEEEE